MRTVIPNELAGASLLGVHNWIKSQVALSNPGGSPDYKLSDMQGRRITLSDVARNPGKEVMIEVETIQGVRSNPSLAAVPGLELAYPVTVRTGNDVTELLPDEIDPKMAQRVIAEQGLRRGLHTLNRLSLQKSDSRITSPTTAALLQMGEIIKSEVRSNPADRTPFTQRTPLIYSPERALASWLAENAGQDLKASSVKAERYTQVSDAKIASRYGLNTDDIEKFANDVLMDYLFSASANRALVRTIISKNIEGIKQDRETIHKLLAMFPQQPQAFYNGAQRVFVAHPAYIYPTFADSIMSNRQLAAIVKFARGYPGNMGRRDDVPRSLKSLVRTGYGVNGAFARFRSWVIGVSDQAYDSTADIDRYFESRKPITAIVEHLARDPREQFRDQSFRPLWYLSDLGGFYPAPPPKWPREVVFAIMDAFLENIPYIVNMKDPGKSNLTPVRYSYLTEPVDKYEVKVTGKTLTMPAKKLQELKKSIEEATNAEQFKKIHDKLNSKLKLKNFNKKSDEDKKNYIKTTLLNALDKAEAGKMTTEAELTFDPSEGKSILEMAYDVAEISQAKYNYNMRGDDFKFVMAMLHYSMETITENTGTSTFNLNQEKFERGIRDFLGTGRYREYQALMEKVENAELDDDIIAGMAQSSVLASLIDVRTEFESELSAPLSVSEQERVRSELREEYDDLVESLRGVDLSPGMDKATQEILLDIRRLIETGA